MIAPLTSGGTTYLIASTAFMMATSAAMDMGAFYWACDCSRSGHSQKYSQDQFFHLSVTLGGLKNPA